MNLKKKGFTLIEIIIALTFFSIIFSSLFSSVTYMSDYVSKSNINFTSMNLAKSGYEKINGLKSKFFTTNKKNKWENFISNFPIGYYKINPITKNIDSVLESDSIDFNNWEGPLDSTGQLKDSNEGLSFYRIVKIADFDVKSTLDSTKDGTIFNCNIDDNSCDFGYEKKLLSNPFLKTTTYSSDTITLEFSTGNIFNTESIFISDLTGSGSFSTNIGTNSNGEIDDLGKILYIDFTGEDPTSLNGKYITLGTESFIFGNNVNIGNTLDESIFNLNNSIKENLENYTSFVFYPNACMIRNLITFYDILSDRETLLPDDCSNIVNYPTTSSISIKGASIENSLNNKTVKPNYYLKFNDSGLNNYTLFKELISARTTNYGVDLPSINGVSSIYSIGVRVIGTRNNEIISDEILESYLTDT